MPAPARGPHLPRCPQLGRGSGRPVPRSSSSSGVPGGPGIRSSGVPGVPGIRSLRVRRRRRPPAVTAVPTAPDSPGSALPCALTQDGPGASRATRRSEGYGLARILSSCWAGDSSRPRRRGGEGCAGDGRGRRGRSGGLAEAKRAVRTRRRGAVRPRRRGQRARRSPRGGARGGATRTQAEATERAETTRGRGRRTALILSSGSKVGEGWGRDGAGWGGMGRECRTSARGYTAADHTRQDSGWTRRGIRHIVGLCAPRISLPSYGGRLSLRVPAIPRCATHRVSGPRSTPPDDEES